MEPMASNAYNATVDQLLELPMPFKIAIRVKISCMISYNIENTSNLGHDFAVDETPLYDQNIMPIIN